HFLANVPRGAVTLNQPLPLLALGEPLSVHLPKAILALAEQNSIAAEQLLRLAGRAQGYPLPNLTLTNNSLQFANGALVPLDPGTHISSGEYQATITLVQGRAMLLLTPILAKLDVLIGPAKEGLQGPILSNTAAQVVLAKTELAQIYRNFVKQLNELAPSAAIAPKLQFTIAQIPAGADDNALNGMRDPALGAKLAAKLTALPLAALALKPSHGLSHGSNHGLNHGTSAHVVAPLGAMPSSLTRAMATAVKAELTIALQPLAQGLVPDGINKEGLASAAHAANPLTNPLLANPQLTHALPTNSLLANPLLANPHSALEVDKTAALYTTVTEVLQKAFTKAGALPEMSSSAARHVNLAAELLKQLPHLSPQPLSQLTDPQTLKDDILGLATLNLAASQLQQSSQFMQASAITSLFQLLLGFKAASTTQAISQRLATYLEQLQRKIGLSAHQLSQISKAGGLESMGQLASNLQL
ncbi:MAG: flagellar hook-length control protein FliK, partial [Shewanella sp.]